MIKVNGIIIESLYIDDLINELKSIPTVKKWYESTNDPSENLYKLAYNIMMNIRMNIEENDMEIYT